MPWSVQRDDRCPAAKPWAVVKETDNSIEGCHASREAGLRQAAALYASEDARMIDSADLSDFNPLSLRRRTWPFIDGEIRSSADGMHFRGYAAVFNVDSQPLPFIETIAPGAFRRSLDRGRDVRMYLNHNTDLILARRKAKTLRLREDDHGLLVDADLPETSYARDLSVSMQRGDVDEMSFGFTVPIGKDEWDGNRRLLREVTLFEVSVVSGFPAYPATSAQVRALMNDPADRLIAEARRYGQLLRVAWSSAYIADLPDSAFACIDETGRHYPHHDAQGNLDLPHLRNALSRVMQEATTSCGRDHLLRHAREAGIGDH